MSAKLVRNQISELEILLEDWIKFHGIFELNSELAMMPSDEFLVLKNSIALRQDLLMNILESEKEVGQMVLDIVSRVAAPDYVPQLSDIAQKRLESEWNSAYVCINETIGFLEKKLDHQVSVARPDQMILQLFRSGGTGFFRIFQSTWFKFIAFLLVIGLIIYGIFAFEILSWEDTKNHLPSFIQSFLP